MSLVALVSQQSMPLPRPLARAAAQVPGLQGQEQEQQGVVQGQGQVEVLVGQRRAPLRDGFLAVWQGAWAVPA